MVDGKTVISQVQEFQLILHEIEAEGVFLPKTFQVAIIMEKLPPAWRYFKNYLKHKHKKLKLEDLIVRLRIEEDNLKSEKRSKKNSYEVKANVIEDSKGKASSSKGLKRKKTARGIKVRTKEARTSVSRELDISTTRRDTGQMNVAIILRRTRGTSHRQI